MSAATDNVTWTPQRSHCCFFKSFCTSRLMSASVQMFLLMQLPQTNDNNKIWNLFPPLHSVGRGENRVSSGKDRLRVSLLDTSSSDKESRNVHRYDGPNLELITPGGIKLTSVWWVPHLSLQSSGHLRSNHTATPYLTSKTPAVLCINLPPFTSSHSAALQYVASVCKPFVQKH